MSYDVWLEITVDTGTDHNLWLLDVNHTSNCAPMWRHAGADLREYDGKPASEAAGPLTEAVARMEADPDTYRAMNPPNGWGDYDTALAFLREIAQACARHSKATVRVSW